MNVVRLILESGQTDVFTEDSYEKLVTILSASNEQVVLNAIILDDAGNVKDNSFAGFPRSRLVFWYLVPYEKPSGLVRAVPRGPVIQ